MARENSPANPGTPGFVLYEAPDGRSRLSVRLEGTTVWLTQAQMAELFQTTPQNITIHIANVYDDRELPEEATCKEYLQVRTEGTRTAERATKHYSLDMIIAVGYRVRSARGTQFRQWATATLAEYLTKGFVLDDTRLKDAKNWGADYFDELLARIRDIRASERRFYQKITDIYATSIDYDPAAPMTQSFYVTVQNKLHWAITGRTAAETIVARAERPSQRASQHAGPRSRAERRNERREGESRNPGGMQTGSDACLRARPGPMRFHVALLAVALWPCSLWPCDPSPRPLYHRPLWPQNRPTHLQPAPRPA